MTPHTQKVLACPIRNDGHDADGNPGDCLRTAIGSLLDLDPMDVPHFAGMDAWFDEMVQWANAGGYELTYLPLPIPEDWQEWWEVAQSEVCYVLVDGPSPRGPWFHVVVANSPDLTLAHDPHPSGDGVTATESIYVFRRGAS